MSPLVLGGLSCRSVELANCAIFASSGFDLRPVRDDEALFRENNQTFKAISNGWPCWYCRFWVREKFVSIFNDVFFFSSEPLAPLIHQNPFCHSIARNILERPLS